MSTAIREFDPAGDAEAVAQFYNRNGYGAISHGAALTGESLLAVLAERDVRLMMVAIGGKQVVGTIAYSGVSGRRAARRNQLFAGQFLIAPSHRASRLAGELFIQSFARLFAMGVRVLRVEVNPSNRRAYPLYIRVGFRAVDDQLPDEEGYIELVSVLPGVVESLRSLFPSEDVDKAAARADWRVLGRSPRATLRGGVYQDPSGAKLVDYTFEVAGSTYGVVADLEDASVRSVTSAGVVTPVPAEDKEPGLDRAPLIREHLGFAVELDQASGQIRIGHEAYLGPLYVDAHPIRSSGRGGHRRPMPQGRVVVEDRTQGWSVLAGGVRREITFTDAGLNIRVSDTRGTAVAALPWIGLRVAELTVSVDGGAPRTAHVLRGRWPVDFTDFESASPVDSTFSDRRAEFSWVDHLLGLRVTVAPRTSARLEGPGLRLFGTTDEVLEYDVRIEGQAVRDVPAMPIGRDQVPIAEETSLLQSDDRGLLSWRMASGEQVLRASVRARTIGPLDCIDRVIWAGVMPERSDPDQGASWIPLPSANAGEARSVIDSRLSLTTTRDGKELHIHLSASADSDTAVFVAPPGDITNVEIADSAGRRIPVRVANGEVWRSWTRAARFTTSAGHLIEITPVSGVAPEILVRATGAAWVYQLCAGPDRGVGAIIWRLRIVEEQP